jgi:hypothetical protein
MRRPTRTCWGERLFPAFKEYAEREHKALFEEARRPISVITPEHLEYLWAEMERQKRFTHGVNVMKTRWEDGDDD